MVETETLKTIRKCVRPVSAQSNFESRRLWQNVTDNLKKGDVDTATQHKRFVSVEDNFLEVFTDDVPVNFSCMMQLFIIRCVFVCYY